MKSRIYTKTKHRKPTLVAICIGLSLILAWLIVNFTALTRSEPVWFDWERGNGFKSIYVERPRFGSFYNHVITLQAERPIVSALETAGWRSAKGRLPVRVFCLFFVVGIDKNNGYSMEIVDPEVTPLMQAAESFDTESVKRLIAQGVNLNAQDQRGWTALMHVGRKGRLEEAKLLLSAGADPSVKDREGRTAFLWAAWNCRSEVVRALINAGADVNVKDQYGSSAMSSTPCPAVLQDIIEKAPSYQKNSRTRWCDIR